MRRATLPLTALLLGAAGAAAPTFTLTFDDPAGLLAPFAAEIEANLLGAAEIWGARLPGDQTIDIVLIADTTIPYSTGRSGTSAYVTTIGGFNVFEQGAAAKVRTGFDANGPAPDIEINLSPAYCANELWFDPDPLARVAPVPNDRLDAVSVFLHELAHAFVFNGWIDGFGGGFPGDYISTFDLRTTYDSENFFFTGSRASGVYGGDVPITYGNPFHLGNLEPRPGEALLPDLMNGVVFFHGNRYVITNLDLAICADTGLPVRPNCPGDADFSGVVAFPDLNIVLSNFGQVAENLPGDVNVDGRVDFTDLNIVLSNFGVTC